MTAELGPTASGCVVVGRDSGGGMRFTVLASTGGSGYKTLLADGGEGWGDSRGVTALAMGDVDGDGDDELAVGRNSGGGMRYAVLDHRNGTWKTSLADGGEGWGDSRGVTALAIGNMDWQPQRDELAVGRNGGGGMRFAVLSFSGEWRVAKGDGGSDWGASHGVTALSIGGFAVREEGLNPAVRHNYEGLWEHMRSLAVGRSTADLAFRIVAYSLTGPGLMSLTDSNEVRWGGNRHVTALAWAGGARLFVGRDDGGGMRYAVLTEYGGTLNEHGSGWGSSRSVSALAVGDC